MAGGELFQPGSPTWLDMTPEMGSLPEGWMEDYENYPDEYMFPYDYKERGLPEGFDVNQPWMEGTGIDPLTYAEENTIPFLGDGWGVTAGEYREKYPELLVEHDFLETSAELEEEREALGAKEVEYLDWLMGEETLSPEEEKMFDAEYDLQLESLWEQFNTEQEYYGGKQMADLVARGVFDSTTGDRAVGERTYRENKVMAGNVAQMGEAKQLAKSDFGAAKTEMAQQGYRLTSSMLQDSLSQSLQISANMQNYYQDVRGSEGSAKLQRALDNFSKDQASYNQRVNTTIGVAGIAAGFA